MTNFRPAARTYRVVGTSPAHHDFVDKVKGSLHYAADWQLPGMLHGRVVRSPLPSARITGIDVTAARALPGVAAVLTAADVPSNQIVELASGGLAELQVTMPVLAADRVRYMGEPVAVVAAATPQLAHEAAELVAVDYDGTARRVRRRIGPSRGGAAGPRRGQHPGQLADPLRRRGRARWPPPTW